MKKFLITLCALAITSIGMAQVVDSTAIKREQQQLLIEQQKQREKEQAELQAKQEKEAKAAEKALAKEQQKEQDKLMEKQKKEAKRAERREAIGRKGHLSVDADLFVGSHGLDGERFYSGETSSFGAELVYHYPLRKRWDLNMGAGFFFNNLTLLNNASLNATHDGLDPYTPLSYRHETCAFNYPTIEIPIRLAYVSEKNNGFYLGLRLSYALKATYGHTWFDATGDSHADNDEVKSGAIINRFGCRLTLGIQEKFLCFAPGYGLFLDLLPTIVPDLQEGSTSIHTFGIFLKF